MLEVAKIQTMQDAMSAPDWFAYVGSRTTKERNARGEGISVYAVDALTGKWTLQQVIGDLVNPSYLALNAKGDRLYCVHGDKSEASSFAIDPATGRASLQGTINTGGRNPVHLTFSPEGDRLFIANYATGSVATLSIGADGRLVEPARLLSLHGETGPHKVEQKGSQPHQVVVSPGGGFLIVPDKGTDCVHILKITKDGLEPHGQMVCREASGPRHMVFDAASGLAYVANELNSTITTCRWHEDTGLLDPIEISSTLPADFTGNSRSSAIVFDGAGQRLLVSNRGHESVCIYSICPQTGALVAPEWIDARGRNPRFFTLDPSGQRLVIANEHSDTIVQIALEDAGTESPTGSDLPTIASGSPVCILFRPMI